MGRRPKTVAAPRGRRPAAVNGDGVEVSNGDGASAEFVRASKMLLSSEQMLGCLLMWVEIYAEIPDEALAGVPEVGFTVIDGHVISSHTASCLTSARAVIAEATA